MQKPPLTQLAALIAILKLRSPTLPSYRNSYVISIGLWCISIPVNRAKYHQRAQVINNISNAENVFEEISKCEIICMQCHVSFRNGCIKSVLHGPLTRYVKLRVGLAPEMPGTFFPPRGLRDPDMHHGTCVTGSLTSSFPCRNVHMAFPLAGDIIHVLPFYQSILTIMSFPWNIRQHVMTRSDSLCWHCVPGLNANHQLFPPITLRESWFIWFCCLV